jgi:hypothetical protein
VCAECVWLMSFMRCMRINLDRNNPNLFGAIMNCVGYASGFRRPASSDCNTSGETKKFVCRS